MIFLKTSLMTITILVVAIWVMPAISQDMLTGAELCEDILKKFCYFKNNEKYSDELFKSKLNQTCHIDGLSFNTEPFVLHYFGDKKIKTSEEIKNKIKSLEKTYLKKLKKEEEKSQKETYLKKLKEEGEKVLDNISHCFKNNESSSDIQKKIDDMKVDLLISEQLLIDDAGNVKHVKQLLIDDTGKFLKDDAGNVKHFSNSKMKAIKKLINRKYTGKIIKIADIVRDFKDSEMKAINTGNSGSVYDNKMLKSLKDDREAKFRSQIILIAGFDREGVYDNKMLKSLKDEIFEIAEAAKNFSESELKIIDRGVFTADEFTVILLKNFAIKYVQYLRDELDKTQNTNPMQEFCNKKFDAKNITEFWKDFYFNVKYSYTQLKDMNDLPIK